MGRNGGKLPLPRILTNLLAWAASDPLIGREKELETRDPVCVVAVKNNPLLGNPLAKTPAIASAARARAGDVPEVMADCTIYRWISVRRWRAPNTAAILKNGLRRCWNS